MVMGFAPAKMAVVLLLKITGCEMVNPDGSVAKIPAFDIKSPPKTSWAFTGMVRAAEIVNVVALVMLAMVSP